MAGYSSTPLINKLGIKNGFTICIVNPPRNFIESLSLPGDVVVKERLTGKCDLIHLFVQDLSNMKDRVLKAAKNMKQDGMIWVSWPKKSSGIKSDLDENLIRAFALSNGLVDVKVCAIDEVWSGLKLVIPIKLRK